MLDMGYGYTSKKQLGKDLDDLKYLTSEEKEKIIHALVGFYKIIVTAEDMLEDNRRDKFVRALLHQLSYDIGEAMICFDEISCYYEDPMEYVKQLEGYKAKKLVEVARKEYKELGGALDGYNNDEFSYHAEEWVDVLY